MTRHVTFALTVAVMLGCGQTPAGSESSTAPAAAPAAAAQASPAPLKVVPTELPDPVARVNGETIGRAEFERAIRTLEGRAGGPLPQERRDEILRGVLDQLVAARLLAQESLARKIAVADADVQARYSQIRQQFPSEEAFAQALTTQAMTAEALRRDIRSDLAVSQLLETAVDSNVSLGETESRMFYDANLERFQQDEAVRASHILIRVAPDADDAAKRRARTEAGDVLKQARAGGDFAALAQEHSQDGSAAQGGDLDFFTRGQMVPPFEAAAFALKVNEISELVETQFGLHIIKVTDRRAPRTVPFAEVDGQIREFLTTQKHEQAVSAFVDTLKSKGKVEILF